MSEIGLGLETTEKQCTGLAKLPSWWEADRLVPALVRDFNRLLAEVSRLPAPEEYEATVSALTDVARKAATCVPTDEYSHEKCDAFFTEIAKTANAAADMLARLAAPATGADFQPRVAEWMQACFGPEISADRIERNHRFIEEALELVQACGCTKSEAHQLVDYVFDRPQGDVNQEVGGVMVTLAALCLANGFDMHQAGENELARVWTKIEKIRAKQAAKPRYSPLPAAPATGAGAWRPIATAPKGDSGEGPDILAFGRITPRSGYRKQFYIGNTRWYLTGWTITYMDGHEAPTHWMPLPEPPPSLPDTEGKQ